MEKKNQNRTAKSGGGAAGKNHPRKFSRSFPLDPIESRFFLGLGTPRASFYPAGVDQQLQFLLEWENKKHFCGCGCHKIINSQKTINRIKSVLVVAKATLPIKPPTPRNQTGFSREITEFQADWKWKNLGGKKKNLFFPRLLWIQESRDELGASLAGRFRVQGLSLPAAPGILLEFSALPKRNPSLGAWETPESDFIVGLEKKKKINFI